MKRIILLTVALFSFLVFGSLTIQASEENDTIVKPLKWDKIPVYSAKKVVVTNSDGTPMLNEDGTPVTRVFLVDQFGNKREWVIMGIHFVHLVQTGKIRREDVINLSDIINGKSEGRTSHDEIVMCSSGGLALEDLSWGYECYQKALEEGIGQKLNLWNEPYMY